MRNIAEFQIIGRVGNVKEVGSSTRVSICANYSAKNDKGEWSDEAHWNEITVFAKSTKTYIAEHIEKGDLVHARGRIRQGSYDKNGERIFTVDLLCFDFARLAKAGAEE